jgi:succinyl-diaminopimelate desuccinylase
MSRTLHLTEELISRPSLTPDDQGCQRILAARLEPLGFTCETIDSGPEDFRVTNLWARRQGSATGASTRTLVERAGRNDVGVTGEHQRAGRRTATASSMAAAQPT